MRAVLMREPGGPEVLQLGEAPRPTKVLAEVLVQIAAAGVNPVDAKTRAGAGASAAIGAYPAILGYDFSGTVLEPSYHGHAFKPGDEVYGMTMVPRFGGTYAEVASVPVTALARKPPSLSHVEAAAVPLAALTAWGAVVDVGQAHDGQRMLIHAGAGGVGHFAVQFASFFGAHVITTGSTRNIGWLRDLGASQVVDHTTTRFEEVVQDVDVVIDLVGNVHDDTGTRSLRVLKPNGLIVNVPTGSWPTFVEDAAAAGMRASGYRVPADGQTLTVISRLLQFGDVKVHVDRVLPLAEAAEAHRLIEAGHTRGKIVLDVA